MSGAVDGFNKDLLYGRITANGMTVTDFAKKIGMNPSTFFRKTSANGSKFSVGEVKAIVNTLGMSNEDACNIFLGRNLH